MASRRRFGRRRKVRTSWVTAVFASATQTFDGTITEYILMDNADWSHVDPDGSTSGLVKPAHVLRSIGDFSLVLTLQNAATQQFALQYFWAVYVIDEDDVDNSIIITSGASSILNKNRVIAGGQGAVATFEGAPSSRIGIDHFPTHKWDTPARIRMRPDDNLALGVQMVASAASTVSSASVNCFARTLIVEP